MRDSRLRAVWAEDGAVINGWLGIPSIISAENMAQAGWDSLTVDLQHGHIDYQVALGMLQAISTTATTPLVRVPWMEPGIIMKLLDAGAYGVICPMINTRADCEAFVGACRYAPAGYRSFGPVRASWYGGADYFAKADQTIVTLAMIETRQAVENLDAILGVPGLDGIYVGPNDLAISLGRAPAGVPTDALVVDTIGRILHAARRHGIRAGIHCGSTGMARHMVQQGFQFVTLMHDNAFLAAGAAAAVTEMRAASPTATGSGVY